VSAPAAPLRILYFAWLRERVGVSEESVVPPASVGTVAELMAWLPSRDERHAAAFAQSHLLRCAVNQTFARPTSPIQPGDEVAFFPPVTGG
jgi:molybdopterin synthase sulfur carrier subunit